MAQPQMPAPMLQSVSISSDMPISANTLGLEDDGRTYHQRGGRSKGLALLDYFLNVRGKPYTKAMSSPVSAYEHCSRLSPYLAFVCISCHATQARSAEIALIPRGEKGTWGSALHSFSVSLYEPCIILPSIVTIAYRRTLSPFFPEPKAGTKKISGAA